MCPQPDQYPDWATDDQVSPVSGQNNVETPPSEKKQYGWGYEEIPPRQWFNWLGRKVAEWIRFIDEDDWVVERRINPGAVITEKVADGAITPVKKSALGQQISASSGTFSTSSASFVDVTNLSVSITTTGRPVFIGLVADGDTTLLSYLSVENGIGGTGQANFQYLRGSTVIAITALQGPFVNSSIATLIPVSSFSIIDTPAAGTYTYKMQAKAVTIDGAPNVGVRRAKLIAYEL